MDNFFQNMLKENGTKIENLNDSINDINKNITYVPNNGNAGQDEKAAVETVDIKDTGVVDKVTSIVDENAALDYLNKSDEELNEIGGTIGKIFTGKASDSVSATKALLNMFNNLSLPFPIFTNGATLSTKNSFSDEEIDRIANMVGALATGLDNMTSSFQSMVGNLNIGGLGQMWQNAGGQALGGLKSAFSAGQIAHINAYNGATASGDDQEIARAKAITAGGQTASETFDSTAVGNSVGTALGKTIDTASSALFNGIEGANLFDPNMKDTIVSGLDVFGGAGTALSNNSQLINDSFSNLLDAFGFNPNGTWNGNINPVTMIPQSIIALRDMAQGAAYIPQIAYDSTFKTRDGIVQNVIDNKNAQYGELKEVKNYTSIGDSVQSGLGLNDYYRKIINGESWGSVLVANTEVEGSAPSLVGEALGADVHQYHMPGARTSEVLYMLNPTKYADALSPISRTGYDPFYILAGEAILSNGQYSATALADQSDELINSIKNSEVVTLDIGWNDWWSMVLQGGPAGFIRSNLQYLMIINEIYQINPDAELVLAGGFNPQQGWDILPFMDDNITEYFMQTLYNTLLVPQKQLIALMYPGKCTVADQSGTEVIRGTPGFLGITLDDIGDNPHPTQDGAYNQANGILQSLGFNGDYYQEADKGYYYKGVKNFEEADIGWFGLFSPFTINNNPAERFAVDLANTLRPYSQKVETPDIGYDSSQHGFALDLLKVAEVDKNPLNLVKGTGTYLSGLLGRSLFENGTDILSFIPNLANSAMYNVSQVGEKASRFLSSGIQNL